MNNRETRVTALEAEAAEKRRFESEGPPLDLAEAVRQGRELALQRILNGEPDMSPEETMALGRAFRERLARERRGY